MRICIYAAALLLILPGCSRHYHSRSAASTTVVQPGKQHGPPPHAPAHGYRHKLGDGNQLRYDSGMKIYIVVDRADHYYDDGFYFRFRSDSWEMSASLSGEWAAASTSKLPKALRKHKKHHK
ncbi:MAG TPA: hypothetical protein VGB13_07020 [Candidatus Krumholzibacteria bacterium]|jgi:hypothetical protein